MEGWRQLFVSAAFFWVQTLGANPYADLVQPFKAPFLLERIQNSLQFGCHVRHCPDLLLTAASDWKKHCYTIPFEPKNPVPVRLCYAKTRFQTQKISVNYDASQRASHILIEFPFGNARHFKGSAIEWLQTYEESIPKAFQTQRTAQGLWVCSPKQDFEMHLRATPRSSYIAVQIRMLDAGCEKQRILKNPGSPIVLPNPDFQQQR